MKKIKVLSYNIHVLNYGKNKEQIVDVIKEIDPDIVGLQEIDMYTDRSIVHGPGNQIKWLAEQLGYRNVTHFCRQFKSMTGMTPVEFRLSQHRGI